MNANLPEGLTVLRAAQQNLATVRECIDYLSQHNASAALRTLSVKLQELSFRADYFDARRRTLRRRQDEGEPPPRKRTRRRPGARPQGDCLRRDCPSRPGAGPQAVGVVSDTSDWSAPGHVSPAAGLMDLRCRM
jgi:hypothetical protein